METHGVCMYSGFENGRVLLSGRPPESADERASTGALALPPEARGVELVDAASSSASQNADQSGCCPFGGGCKYLSPSLMAPTSDLTRYYPAVPKFASIKDNPFL